MKLKAEAGTDGSVHLCPLQKSVVQLLVCQIVSTTSAACHFLKQGVCFPYKCDAEPGAKLNV